MVGKTKRKRKQKTPPMLRVAFDTNVLFTNVAHFLLSRDAKEVIENNSDHVDLRVEWCLPRVVVGEREYQMQRRALELYEHVKKLDRLLDIQSTNEGIIRDRIRKVIEDQIVELKIRVLDVQTDEVDWREVVNSSVYRRPPFDPGEREKGFRDAVIAQEFFQLVADSPKTPRQCRLAFVCDDELLREHVEQQTASNQNVRVLESLSDLEGLINTLVSDVPEAKVAEWKDKAQKYFFEKDDKSTLYYKNDIGTLLSEAYAQQLAEKPAGSFIRQNGTWYIQHPVFDKKEGQRIHWTTQITVEAELFSISTPLFGLPFVDDGSRPPTAIPTQSREKAGTGKSIIEVRWSVSISPQRESLSAPKIEGHEFIETAWQMAQPTSNALTDAIFRMNLSQSS